MRHLSPSRTLLTVGIPRKANTRAVDTRPAGPRRTSRADATPERHVRARREVMPTVRIPCSACHGHGEVALPAPYQQTLARLTGEWTRTGAVLRRHAYSAIVRPTRATLINRLNVLVRWGLVDRRGSGRAIEWRRI